MPPYVSIRQHMSAYVSIREHTSELRLVPVLDGNSQRLLRCQYSYSCTSKASKLSTLQRLEVYHAAHRRPQAAQRSCVSTCTSKASNLYHAAHRRPQAVQRSCVSTCTSKASNLYHAAHRRLRSAPASVFVLIKQANCMRLIVDRRLRSASASVCAFFVLVKQVN
jgi:hypothetical protein